MRSISFHSKMSKLEIGSSPLSLSALRYLTRMKGSTGPPQVFFPYMPKLVDD